MRLSTQPWRKYDRQYKFSWEWKSRDGYGTKRVDLILNLLLWINKGIREMVLL